ncbi:MAG: ATP-binding protein [Bacteroidota bacterium]
MTQQEHILTIPSATQYLAEVRRFVEKRARTAGLPDDVVDQFKLAVDEACSNVIEHAYAGEASHTIDIKVVSNAARFTVLIRDQGRSFEPQHYRSPDLFDLVQHRKDGGFGVHLMRRLMDRVEYRRRGSVNEVSLTKYVPEGTLNAEARS